MAKNLPKQVQKQSEEVQELYKEVSQEEETGEVTEDTTDSNSEPEQATEPEQEEQQASGTQEEDYEQKWKTLQGMYNAEVPNLKAQNQNLQGRISQMEQLISSMETKKEPAKAPEKVSLVTQDDIDEFGDSIDMMRKVTKEESFSAQNRIAQLETELADMKTNILPKVDSAAQAANSSREQVFWSELSTSVPNWQEINGNQGFKDWLNEVDPLTGITRQAYLDDAQKQFDAKRVTNFFTTWESLKGTPAAQTNQASKELAKQVAPKKGRTTSTQVNPGQQYSPEDIKKFFSDVQKGKYRGREKERDKIERDIFAAQTDYCKCLI